VAGNPRNDISVVETTKLSAPVRGRLESQAAKWIGLVARLGKRYRRLAFADENWRPDPEDIRILEWCTRTVKEMLIEQRMRSQLTKGVEVMSDADYERELDEIMRARIANMSDEEVAKLRARAVEATEPPTNTSAPAPSLDRSSDPGQHASPAAELRPDHSNGRTSYADDEEDY
jgi:hypothetical protein